MRWRLEWELTLFARCMLLMFGEFGANALIWIITAVLFTRHASDAHILSLALVAWTTGLRHGLDADHISAIDNATRRIVSVPQVVKTAHGETRKQRRPVTVGLFFSLGHSTIVFAVTVAIAVSADVANHLGGVGDVGGIIGAAISGSFLVLIGCINSVILWRTFRRLRRANRRTQTFERGHAIAEDTVATEESKTRFNGCMTRVALPLLKMVDRPWKMYGVGLLFGLGFDTASSIALLGVAAIALQHSGPAKSSSGDSRVVLLALLFTAGMTAVDSADSCLMIWAYAPERGGKRMALLKRPSRSASVETERDSSLQSPSHQHGAVERSSAGDSNERKVATKDNEFATQGEMRKMEQRRDEVTARLDAPASRFSMVLTLLSIFVAFAIGIVVLLGLIGDECGRCSRAADKQDESGDGGLEGRWWLTWRRANDNSGYVGAGIVGAFAVCVVAWALAAWIRRKATQSTRRKGSI